MDRPKAAKVRIVYPKPGVAPAMVAPSALEHWRSLGWMTEKDYAAWLKARTEAEAEAAPLDPPGEPAEPPADAAPAADRPARKRRAPKENSE